MPHLTPLPRDNLRLLATSLLLVLSAPAQQWQPLPLITQAARDAGTTIGGEEGQWPQTVAVEPNNASYMLFGIDVGGIFRSEDQGATWEPANVGNHNRGCNVFAIDPNNTTRVLTIGGSQAGNAEFGIHLSTDSGKTWARVKSTFYQAHKKFRDDLAYDKSSLAHGRSQVAYWSAEQSATGGPQLWKSTDGGTTWAVINRDPTYGNKSVKVSPANGTVYLTGDGQAGNKAFYRSTDGGANFTTVYASDVLGVDVIYSQPNNVYLARADGIYTSTDHGATFTRTGRTALPLPEVNRLWVSPADPHRMLLWGRADPKDNFSHRRHYTHDGGHTWTQSVIEIDPARFFFAWPQARHGAVAWHPTNPQRVFSNGQDAHMMSDNGGASFQWRNNGVNNFSPNGIHPFNPFHPELVATFGWDKSGAVSTDGGHTWRFTRPIPGQGYPGGHAWGGYFLDRSTLVAWGKANRHNPAFPWTLARSTDGGATWITTAITRDEEELIVIGDPAEPNYVYAGKRRSVDRGENWTTMANVRGVITASAVAPFPLYGIGADDHEVVVSTDHGAAWQPVVRVGGAITDVAYDHTRDRLYVAAANRLYQYALATRTLTDLTARTPDDQLGRRTLLRVCVDPVDPTIIYATNLDQRLVLDNAVVRSRDAGETWDIISRSSRFPNPQFGKDGGRSASSARVHPVTRELWIHGGTFGLWRFGGAAAAPIAAGVKP
jgi:hypothetical protein